MNTLDAVPLPGTENAYNVAAGAAPLCVGLLPRGSEIPIEPNTGVATLGAKLTPSASASERCKVNPPPTRTAAFRRGSSASMMGPITAPQLIPT